jgi:hypothetical protein
MVADPSVVERCSRSGELAWSCPRWQGDATVEELAAAHASSPLMLAALSFLVARGLHCLLSRSGGAPALLQALRRRRRRRSTQ